MLPFLKTKKVAGLIISSRKPDGSTEELPEENEQSSIDTCSQDLLKAVEAKDIKGISEALKSAFTILDSIPHHEGEHLDESYNSQNIKASKQERE